MLFTTTADKTDPAVVGESESLLDLAVTDIDGNEMKLRDLTRDKKLCIVVNVASK